MASETAAKKIKLRHTLLASFIEFRITGLDISDLSMKYVSMDRTRKNKILIKTFGEIKYPEGIIVNGEVKDEQKFTEILKQWFAKEKKNLPSPFVAISLPEEKSFIRAVQIPHVKPDDVANAIRWEIENQIPLPLEEVIYDYEIVRPLTENQDHLDVIITAFPRDILSGYVQSISASGLQLYAIELESQSLMRACLPSLSSLEAQIVVDVGRTRTSFVIYAGGAILYTSTIKSGGLIFEQYISKQLNVGKEEATKLKIEVGLDKSQRNGEVFGALAPAITIIGDELVRAISYYETHAAHAHGSTPSIQNILISGGDANLRGLDTYLASVLKVRVDRADTFSVLKDQLAYDIPPLTRKDALAYAISIGLALRDIRKE